MGAPFQADHILRSDDSGSHLVTCTVSEVNRTCSRSMAVRYAQKWLKRTLGSVSTLKREDEVCASPGALIAVPLFDFTCCCVR